jgi:hypothetical protein
VTRGGSGDRKPVADLLSGLLGQVFADRSDVSQPLAQKRLQDFGMEFFAKPKRNRKNKLMPLSDKLRTRKHAIMESVIDQLENIAQIEHTHSASESHQFLWSISSAG